MKNHPAQNHAHNGSSNLWFDSFSRMPSPAMKLLLSSRVEDLDVLKGMLSEEGIACEVTNYENPLPGAEFYPNLWVAEGDFAAASAVLSAFRNRAPAPVGPWTCPSCGEKLEGQSTSCWKRGGARDAVA
jgi:hypothetical protein